MSVDVTARFRLLAPSAPTPSARGARGRSSVFDVEAAELLSNLAEMEGLVREMRPKYLRPKTFIRTKGVQLSEQDKDEFDADLVELVKNCSSKIDALKAATDAQHVVTTQVQHQREVVVYLLERLKGIADGAKRMQKKRYQQPFLLSSRLLPEDERINLDALEQKVARAKEEKKKKLAVSVVKRPQALASPASPALSPKSPPPPSATAAASVLVADTPPPKPEVRQRSAVKPRKPKPAAQMPMFASQSEELEFTEEEDRRFRVENVMLHRHFQENLEDAKKMESKMAEISNLMGQFADKIMEQQTDIELIQQHAQETKTNVTQSNRILEQTQKIGNGYGFMIFCFYAGFSVILHMLHYFNS